MLISADGANSYHKMLHCSVYCFSLWCHCQLIPINKNFLIRFGDFLSEGVFIQSPQEAKTEAEHSFLQSKLASPPKPERSAKLPGNLCFQYDDKQNLLSGFCLPAGFTSIKDFKTKNKNLSFLSTTFVTFCFQFPRVFCVFCQLVSVKMRNVSWLLFKDTFEDDEQESQEMQIYLWPNDQCWQVKQIK